MQRAYKLQIAVYSLIFLCVENHCIKKMIIIIILNIDVSLLCELVWDSFGIFIKRSVLLLWLCWMLRPGYILVFVVFLLSDQIRYYRCSFKKYETYKHWYLSDKTCFVVHFEYEGNVMRRLKDVWLKYTCTLKGGCMITMTLASHNIYLWIMYDHLNF